MKHKPSTINKALQLAVWDWSTKGKPPDSEIAKKWKVSERSVRGIRETDAYKQALMDLQDQAIQYVGEELGQLQAMALGHIQKLLPELSESVIKVLRGSPEDKGYIPGSQSIDTARDVLAFLLDIVDRSRSGPAGPEPKRIPMPQLQSAESDMTNIRKMTTVTEFHDTIDGATDVSPPTEKPDRGKDT